jgi:CelD/BcsL family acetyltransferase involved in cellulose biosynthesis
MRMGLLSDLLTDRARLRTMAGEVAELVDGEVSRHGGFSGIALKTAFGVVKAVKPGILAETAEGLLPEFARALDPLLAARPPEASWPTFFADRSGAFVAALLAITDERARRTSHQTLAKAYEKLRPSAEKYVLAALPAVAGFVERYVPALGRTG